MPTTIHHILIPPTGSPCATWKTYFQQLKRKYGAANARQLWLFTWKHRGSSSCTTDPAFVKWLKKQDLDVSSTATSFVADISQIGKNFMGLGKNMSKVLSLALPITLGLVGLGFGYVIYQAARKPELLSNLHPAGRAANLLTAAT